MNAWRWAALGAMATIIVGLSFGQMPVDPGCHAVAGHPWADLQDATSADAAIQIMDACGRNHLPNSMWLDALAFIPSFTLLLGALLFALRPPRWLLRGGLGLLFAGVIADQVEGGLLLRSLGLPNVTDADVQQVAAVGQIKMVCLALATFVIGFLLAHLSGWRRWAGLTVIIGSVLTIAAELSSLTAGALGLLIAWLILSLISVVGAVATGQPASAGTVAPSQ
jgi:hypothetical protein